MHRFFQSTVKVLASAMLAILFTMPAANATNVIQSGLGTCLDAAGNNPTNGTNVHSWACHGKINQQWTFNGFKLVNGSGLCLDIYGPDKDKNGANVIIWSCHGGPNQQWTITPDGLLRNANGRCVDIAGGSSADRTNVVVYDCHGGKNQRWSTPVNYSRTYDNRSSSFVAINGPFRCKKPVENEVNGCDVPKNFKDIEITPPSDVPGFLIDIAESGMDGLFDDDDYNKFRGACNLHDICYRAPWHLGRGGKVDCEAQFEKDLSRKCDQVHDDGSPNWAVCKITAASMAAAVRNHGQSRFDSGQAWSRRNCIR